MEWQVCDFIIEINVFEFWIKILKFINSLQIKFDIQWQ